MKTYKDLIVVVSSKVSNAVMVWLTFFLFKTAKSETFAGQLRTLRLAGVYSNEENAPPNTRKGHILFTPKAT